MRNTALGYRIVNGKAVIDEKEAIIVRELYRNYLDGMSLCASAEKVGLKLPASSVSRILQNRRYLGDDFYPPLIDEETYSRTLQERERRMKALSRTNLLKPKIPKTAPAEFFFSDKDSLHKGTPAEVAEYLYSMIRIKEKTNG